MNVGGWVLVMSLSVVGTCSTVVSWVSRGTTGKYIAEGWMALCELISWKTQIRREENLGFLLDCEGF